MKRKFNPLLPQLRAYLNPPSMSGNVTVSQEFIGKLYQELVDLYDEHEALAEEVDSYNQDYGHLKDNTDLYPIFVKRYDNHEYVNPEPQSES